MSTANSPLATLRRGIALPIALAAIVAVGALVAGAFFAATQEYRVGRNTLAAQRALHSAEIGLSQVVSSWTSARTAAAMVGQTVTLPDTMIDGALVQRQYTKVSPTVFWVTCTAMAGGQSLQARSLKRLNSIIRIQTPNFRIMGALMARGRDSIGGIGSISGIDTVPPGWDCPAAGPPTAGLVVNDSALNAISFGGCDSISGKGLTQTVTEWTCVDGSPQVKDSSALVSDTSTYKDFGTFNYDSLTKLANVIHTAGGKLAQIKPSYNLDGSCNTTDPLNWGDTSHVDAAKRCDSYYPVVWLKGNGLSWSLDNYGGQGILLVDGNLTIAGIFQWTGVVIVLGDVDVAGSGSLAFAGPKVVGAVMAMNRNGGTNTVKGNATVQFSRCAIQQVAAGRSIASTTRFRAWADLSF